jgi:hypothetical protein
MRGDACVSRYPHVCTTKRVVMSKLMERQYTKQENICIYVHRAGMDPFGLLPIKYVDGKKMAKIILVCVLVLACWIRCNTPPRAVTVVVDKISYVMVLRSSAFAVCF